MHRPSALAFTLAAVVGFLFAPAGCFDKHKSDRTPEPAFLGVGINQRGEPGIDADFSQAYLAASQGRFGLVQVRADWGEIEPGDGTLRLHDMIQQGVLARQRGLPIALEVLVLDNEVRGGIPADLRDLPLGDPVLIARFTTFLKNLVDWFRTPGNLDMYPPDPRFRVVYLWIGREADQYLLRHPGEIEGFRRLLAVSRDSIRAEVPGILVGTIVSASDGGTASAEVVERLSPSVDRIGLTVYGRDAEYEQVLGPQATLTRIADAVGRFGPKRVVLCEVGYPAVFPEMAEQESFARLLVGYLAEPPENLEGAVWCQLYDMHETRAREASHRIYPDDPEQDARYVAQLRSLGLSMVDGTPKLAWYVVRDAGLGSP